MELHCKIKELKTFLMWTFCKHCDSGLYTLKFQLLDYVVKGFRVFRTLFVLDAIPVELYSVIIWHFYRQSLRRRDACINETVNMKECQLDGQEPDKS